MRYQEARFLVENEKYAPADAGSADREIWGKWRGAPPEGSKSG
jgi:hypothetical protein